MIKKLSALILILGVMLGAAFMTPVTANAIGASTDPLAAQCKVDPSSTVCKQSSSPNALVKNIVTTLLFVVGAVSVVVIIVGGLMFATSAGDASRVTMGKNMIAGAVIGLVVSVLAFAIVQYVFTKFK